MSATMRAMAAVLLTATAIMSSAAAPAIRWFLTIDAWSHTNASLAPRDKATIYWEEPFSSKEQCRAQLRTIQKNPGLIAEQVGGAGVAKIVGRCGTAERSTQ